MPSVEPRPSSSSWPGGVAAATSSAPRRPAPKTTQVGRRRTATEITLLAIGAHIIGPNRPRALSTCPTSTNMP